MKFDQIHGTYKANAIATRNSTPVGRDYPRNDPRQSGVRAMALFGQKVC